MLPAGLLGRFVACCQLGHYRLHRQVMRAAIAAAAELMELPSAIFSTRLKEMRDHSTRLRIDDPHSAQPAKRQQSKLMKRRR